MTRVSTAAYAAGKDLAPRPVHSTLRLDKITATGFRPEEASPTLQRYLAAQRDRGRGRTVNAERDQQHAGPDHAEEATAGPGKVDQVPDHGRTGGQSTPAVVLQLSASVSRVVGTAASTTATEAISVGAMAIPLTSSRPPTGSGLPRNGSGSNDAPARPRRSGTGSPTARQAGAGHHAGQQGTERPGGDEAKAGEGQHAGLPCECDDDDLHAAEHPPEGQAGQADRQQDAQRQPPDRLARSGGTAGGWVDRCPASSTAPTRPITAETLPRAQGARPWPGR